MRILVTFAVEAEFAPWRRMHSFQKEELFSGGHTGKTYAVYRTAFDHAFLDVGFTGIGWRGVNLGLEHLLAKKPDVWISSGLAGALTESVGLNEVIAPRAILSKSDAGESPTNRLEVDKELHELALKAGAKDAECLLTARQVLTLAAEKKAQSSVAELVDMESFEAMKEARKRGSRGVVIRAISDNANEDLPINFNDTLSVEHEVSMPRVLLQLARNPFAMNGLIRFGRQSRKAAGSLSILLDKYVQSVANVQFFTSMDQVASR